MKIRITAIFLFLFSLHCNRDFSPLEQDFLNPEKVKFFHPESISQLLLENMYSFWGNDTVNTIEEETMVFIIIDSTGSVRKYPGYYKSIFYWSENNLTAVSVFESQAIAIEAMEERRKNVSMLIFPSDSHDKIKDRWWWGVYRNFQREIFVNRWNTIVEACILYYDYNKDDSVRTLLENTALEIIGRVDKLSVELK